MFVSEEKIHSMMEVQGAFDKSLSKKDFISSSTSLSISAYPDFDYSSAVLYSIYDGVKRNNELGSMYLFIPEGDKVAHNLMIFGNFLWGATGNSFGIPSALLKAGAHLNSLGFWGRQWNRNYNGYPPQFDSRDDQLSISEGVKHAKRSNYKQFRK